MFVGKNIFQREHFARQRVEIFLRLINQRETFVELGEVLKRARCVFFQAIAEPCIEAIDAFRQKAREIGLAAFKALANL